MCSFHEVISMTPMPPITSHGNPCPLLHLRSQVKSKMHFPLKSLESQGVTCTAVSEISISAVIHSLFTVFKWKRNLLGSLMMWNQHLQACTLTWSRHFTGVFWSKKKTHPWGSTVDVDVLPLSLVKTKLQLSKLEGRQTSLLCYGKETCSEFFLAIQSKKWKIEPKIQHTYKVDIMATDCHKSQVIHAVMLLSKLTLDMNDPRQLTIKGQPWHFITTSRSMRILFCSSLFWLRRIF